MRRFLIASHGHLSSAILQSASMIAGKNRTNSCVHIGVEQDDSRDKVKDRINQVLDAWNTDDEILVLTDIIGGNVTNILCEQIKVRNLHIITGMNLGMVLEALFAEEETPIEELAEDIVAMGKTGIKYVNTLAPKNEEEEI